MTVAQKSPKLTTRCRKGGYSKSAFIDMRNTVVGNWLVQDYLFSQDLLSLDSDWTDHFWSVRCIDCGTSAILERREIRGKRPKPCPVCTAKQRAAQREAKVRSKMRAVNSERLDRMIELEATKGTAGALYKKGMKPPRLPA